MQSRNQISETISGLLNSKLLGEKLFWRLALFCIKSINPKKMKSKTLLFGFIPLPGSQDVAEHQLTHYLVVAVNHNKRPWYKRVTRRIIKGYEDPLGGKGC